RTSLREPEDVVDEHEHVRVLDVAEILRHRQPRKAHAETCTRRLVHLAVVERDLVENLGFLELEIEIVPFARPLAHAAEHGTSAVALRDVVDELLDDDGLAHTGAAEETDLSTLHERGDEVDDLDARLEHLGLRLEVHEVRALAMDGPARRVL